MSSTELGDNPIYKGAKWYASKGWHVLACHGLTEDGRCTCGKVHDDPKDIAKHPAISEWQQESVTNPATSQIDTWWTTNPRYNVAVACRSSGFFVIDIDPRSGGDDTFDRFEALVEGELPPTVEAITGSYMVKGKAVRGRHLYYKYEGNERLIGKLETLSKDLKGVDIKHNGYTMLYPSRHLSGVIYEWKPGHAPWEIEMAEAPELLLSTLREKSGRRYGGSSAVARTKHSVGDGWDFVRDLEFQGEKIDLDKFQREGITEGSRAVDIYAMTCALANKYGTSDGDRKYIETMMIRFNHEMVSPPLAQDGAGGLLMHVHRAIDFVASNPKYAVTEMGQKAHVWAKERQLEVRKNGGSVHMPVVEDSNTESYDNDSLAQQYAADQQFGDIGESVARGAYNGVSMGDMRLDVPMDEDSLSPESGGDPNKRSLTDVGNGRRLVDSFGVLIRYTPGLGWFNWTGSYWKTDVESLGTKELAKSLASIIAGEIIHYDDPNQQQAVMKWSNQAKSNGKLGAAVENAQTDPRVTLDVESWDSNVEQLGVMNGVVDLKTGDLLKGRPDLFITRRAPVAYVPGATNKRWMDFLDYGTGGDKEYQEWLQKAAGYTLTGRRDHDVMFMVYGPGGSGKNVLVESLVKVMGTKQYAWPMDSQILAQNDGHASSTDLYHWAELRGRRMIWVDELPESERLKENSVKKLTGSSEISARSPGEKPFTFSSRGKLWVTTNHRPIITDDAMWRRIRPIPWLNVPTEPDPGLKAYLFDPEGGLPSVLAWAVEGAMKVINSTEKDSLGWCSVVREAADIYRKNEDRIGMFLNEETVEAKGNWLRVTTLFSVYQLWSEERGEKPMSQIAFQRKLTDRGLMVEGTGGRALLGDHDIAVKTVPTASAEPNWGAMSRFAR